jgi:hypothetical protein
MAQNAATCLPDIVLAMVCSLIMAMISAIREAIMVVVPAAVAVAEGSISISCAANQNHMFLKRTSVAIDSWTKIQLNNIHK